MGHVKAETYADCEAPKFTPSALLPRLWLPLHLPDHTARMTLHFLQWTVCSRAEVMPCLSELTVPDK